MLTRPHNRTATDTASTTHWVVSIREHRTRLERRVGGEVEWAGILAFGDAALLDDSDIAAIVSFTNQVHGWLEANLPRSASPASGPLVVEQQRQRRLRSRRPRTVTADAWRSSINDRRLVPAAAPQLAGPIIIDCLLDHLGIDVMSRVSPSRARGRAGGWRQSVAVSAAVAVGMASSVVAATHALVSDQVAMAAVTAEGGTLDIKLDSSTTTDQDGPNANWGTFSASLELMKPGDVRYADVTLRNPGTLPARVTVTTTGTDAHADYASAHCFGFWFRERSLGSDVQSIGTGTELGTSDADGDVIQFHSGTGPNQLYADGATRSDSRWTSGMSRTYRLTVRMLDGCLQGGEATVGATGTLNVSFDAVQD